MAGTNYQPMAIRHHPMGINESAQPVWGAIPGVAPPRLPFHRCPNHAPALDFLGLLVFANFPGQARLSLVGLLDKTHSAVIKP